MLGVTHIQIQASLYYDDGFVVTMTSPIIKKDIRQGDYFPDDQIADILAGVGNQMAESVLERTAIQIHDEIKRNKEYEGRPFYWRKPKWNEPHSDN